MCSCTTSNLSVASCNYHLQCSTVKREIFVLFTRLLVNGAKFLSLRYGWSLQNPPSHCTSSHLLSIEHSLTCITSGFTAIRHNEVHDITASFLLEVCHGVTIEPHLQPLTGEVVSHNSAIVDDGVCLDRFCHVWFWGGCFEKAFVDIRVFNLCAQSNR